MLQGTSSKSTLVCALLACVCTLYPARAQMSTIVTSNDQMYPQQVGQAQLTPVQQAYPQDYIQDDIYTSQPMVKGYAGANNMVGSAISHPVQPQYWTGYPAQQPQMYAQPQPYYPQQYPMYQPAMVPQPRFDAGYWTGSFQPYHAAPVYGSYGPSPVYGGYGPRPVYGGYGLNPVHGGYGPKAVYYQGKPGYHPAYPHHGYAPVPKKSNKIAKTLLGAAVVGAVAGAVARG